MDGGPGAGEVPNAAVVNPQPAVNQPPPPPPPLPPATLWQIIVAILRVIWIAIDNVIEITVFTSLMFTLLPLRWICPDFYWDFESFLFREMMRMVGYWIWSAGYKIVEYGDVPFRLQNERCLVVCNHLSTADVPTLLAATCKKGVDSGKVMWILDVMFKWSNIGIVSQIRGDFFIESGKPVRHLQADRLAEHMKSCYWSRKRRWMVVFPEGGFLANRRESNRIFAEANGFPVFRHCTLPRFVAITTALDTANPKPKHPQQGNDAAAAGGPGLVQQVENPPPAPAPAPVLLPGEQLLPCCINAAAPAHQGGNRLLPGFRYLIDITLAYQNGNPLHLRDIFYGIRPPCEIGLHYRVIRIENVPRGNDIELRDYFFQLWQEKDNLLDHYNRFGHFPGIQHDDGTAIESHWAGLVMRCAFFIAATVAIGYVWSPVGLPVLRNLLTLIWWLSGNLRALFYMVRESCILLNAEDN